MNAQAAPLLPSPRAIEERGGPLPQGEALDRLVREEGRPIVFRGVGAQLPLVRAARTSDAAAGEYLRQFAQEQAVTVYRAPAEAGGRFHYNDAVDGFNFTAERQEFGSLLDELLSGPADTLYLGSTDLDRYFPGMRAENDPGVAEVVGSEFAPVIASLWLGNRTVTAAHYDFSNNCAMCAAGRRRFTLFPPDQIANLYPGPLEPTPGGQVVSMVDFSAPDLDRFPRFAQALEAAQTATLEPGDAIVYPAMWWHQVEGLDAFNVLLNWWWNATPDYIDSPQITLLHALMAIRQRPEHERAAWRDVFDFYAFGDPENARAHLPGTAQGMLAEMDPMTARRLRADLTRKIQR